MYRKYRGYTQEQIAKRVGVSQSTIASWELDITEPTKDQAEALSKLFRVSVRDLFPYNAY